MKISIERSGGFAGINKSYVVDTGRLTPKETKKIEKIVKDGKLFSVNSVAQRASKHGPADYYSYSVTFEDEGTRHTVTCNQFDVPKELRMLIDYVEHGITKGRTNLLSK